MSDTALIRYNVRGQADGAGVTWEFQADECGQWLEAASAIDYIAQLEVKLGAMKKLLDTPEIDDFDKAIPLEAAHQVKRWGAEQDAGKTPADWFWLVGFLAGKALTAHIAGNIEKAKHHCISTAAALRNWHAHIRSGESTMRPGIAAQEGK